MTKKVFAIVMLTALFFTSCKDTPKQETKNSETTSEQKTVSVDDKVVGTYKANVPGANSEIQIELTLNADKTFIIKSVYIDKSNEVFTENGKYKIENNQLELIGYEGAKYFVIEEGYLRQLDISGKVIETTFPEKYKYIKQIK